jgi:CRP-like cAMP-binding protein
MKLHNMPEAPERFRKKMESFSPVSDEDFQRLPDVMHEKHFHKGEVLLKEGQVCSRFYFILRGCIRSFCLEDGKEVNTKFYFEDDIACDFNSFRSEEPSPFYFVALEDVTAYYGSKADVKPLFQDGSSWHMVLFRLFQSLYLEEEKHSNNFKLLTPEERYHFLLENKPNYLRRIPLVYLASYLGVSRETLTRIRQRTA